GTEADILAELAHFVDAAVRRRVDFDDVHRAAGGDLETARALAARRRSRTLEAVQAARQNARDGRLSGPSLAGKDVAVGDPVLSDGVVESGLDVLLIDHVAERLRPVFASDYLIHGAGNCQAPGNPRHTNRTTTVASFRTWRGLRPSVARSPRPDKH